MQTAIVIIVVALAMACAAWKIVQRIRGKDGRDECDACGKPESACAQCPLNNACKKIKHGTV